MTLSQSALALTVGTVNMEKLLPKLHILQNQELRMQGDLHDQYNKLRDEIADMQKRNGQDQSKMSAKEKDELKTKMANTQQRLRKEAMRLSSQLIKSRANSVQKVRDKFKAIVAQVAKSKQVDLVFPEQSMLYSGDSVDLTADVAKAIQ